MQTSAVLSPRSKKEESCASMGLAECVCGEIEPQPGVEIVVHPACFLDEVEAASHASLASGEQPRGFFRDEFALVRVQDRLVERHPAERRAGLNDFVEAAV